jgi:hypothetical protein
MPLWKFDGKKWLKTKTSSTSKFKKAYLLTNNQTKILLDSFLSWTLDESINSEHLQNKCSILNMWPRSSQNLKLQINNYGITSSHSPNSSQVYECGNGHGMFWTLVTRKRNNTLSTNFFTGKMGAFYYNHHQE